MTALSPLAGPLAFGTMQFGAGADAAASAALFAAARAAGIAHFDTAHGYADGRAETLLGRLAASERDALFIATKVAYTGGATRANIASQFDISRRRLGMEAVDLLYIHRHDPATDLSETLDTLADLQDRGLIRHIGLSNFAAWQAMKAQALAIARGTRIAAIQPMLNLVKRQAEVEILPMAADQGIAAFTYSPLGGGLLTGKYLAGGTGRLTEDARYATRYGDPAMAETARALAALAGETGHHPATLAVAWLLHHPARPVPILSARSTGQLAPALAAQGLALAPDLRARLGALSPAPPPATDRTEER
jgi:aryl-alcohol dehydrogenase-like predicted oxidoreductase